MCDCYEHKCKECEEKLPIHLGDFATERNEIEVFCEKHLPNKDVRIFVCCPITGECAGKRKYGTPFYMGIRSLTENAEKHEDQNAPNMSYDFELLKIGKNGKPIYAWHKDQKIELDF